MVKGSGLLKKQDKYRETKALAIKFGVVPPNYRNSTLADLEFFISQINPLNIRYLDIGNGMLKCYLNNFNTNTSNKLKIFNSIKQVLDDSKLKKSMTNNSDFQVKLQMSYEVSKQTMYKSKNFNSYSFSSFNTFKTDYKAWTELNQGQGENYTSMINQIIITLIRENSGGCNKQTVICSKGLLQYQYPQARDNNCFFSIVSDYLSIPQQRIMKEVYNQVRSEFNIEPNQPITISKALEIFDYYKIDLKDSIKILECETNTFHYSTKGNMDSKEIKLENGHYSAFVGIKEAKPKSKCPTCLHEVLTSNLAKHKCNPNNVSYVNSKIQKKGRSLICNIKDEISSTIDRVIHYDIETYRKKINTDSETDSLDTSVYRTNDNVIETHEPYIVGYDLNDGNGYKTIEGDNCMNKFVCVLIDYTTSKSQKVKYFVNAYNGANFDHYFIWKEFKTMNIKPDKFAISNGSLVMFEYKNFKCIDLCKHLQGSLSQNLKSFNCSIAKGEFNHDLAKRWEDMSPIMKEEIKIYLQADVNGLKELYEKVNETIFDKYKLNLSSYISTSSLTYTLWKQNINRKHFIQLPNISQEEGFRQSVRGGRTYLSKKRFISNEYNDVISGIKKFEDINDYVVDCDVVSLYPTAMAKYEYPTGECFKYDVSKPKVKGVMGIYKIKYETNKNCQHSIGGRRECGALKWDLQNENDGAWHTSVDIEDMISNGYKVEYLEGWYWTQKEFIFQNYVEDLFKKKEQSAKGSVEYSLAKLFMNALYGKTIQRPIYSKSEIIKSNSHYWKFRNENHIKEIHELGKDIIIIGEPRNDDKMEKCISKPTHLGAFILAYSRRIMVNYMKEANPFFNSQDISNRINNDFYYTDTDSLQMHIKNAKLMTNFGGKKLGCIDDDLGGAKIIRGLWIAPKLYMLEYINNKNEIHHHFRGKGLTNNSLTVAVFEKLDAGGNFTDTRKFQMKKINIKRNGSQVDVPQFSIIHYDSNNINHKSRLTRTVNEVKWNGRHFIDDCNSIPF